MIVSLLLCLYTPFVYYLIYVNITKCNADKVHMTLLFLRTVTLVKWDVRATFTHSPFVDLPLLIWCDNDHGCINDNLYLTFISLLVLQGHWSGDDLWLMWICLQMLQHAAPNVYVCVPRRGWGWRAYGESLLGHQSFSDLLSTTLNYFPLIGVNMVVSALLSAYVLLFCSSALWRQHKQDNILALTLILIHLLIDLDVRLWEWPWRQEWQPVP